jgi:hypothetical protein
VAEKKAAEPCELAFGDGFVLGDSAEVALEDYARVLTSALRAEAVRGETAEGRITAVRLVDPSLPPSAAQHRDIEDFARSLAVQNAGSGLGWA